MSPADAFVAELLRMDYISNEQADLIRGQVPRFLAYVEKRKTRESNMSDQPVEEKWKSTQRSRLPWRVGEAGRLSYHWAYGWNQDGSVMITNEETEDVVSVIPPDNQEIVDLCALLRMMYPESFYASMNVDAIETANFVKGLPRYEDKIKGTALEESDGPTAG